MKPAINPHITIGLVILKIALSLTSCAPEFGGPDPFNYEDFVEEQDKYPAFSPDGEHIAYYHYSSQWPEPVDYPSGLYIIDKNGGSRALVLAGYHENPSWSPDGQWLVFSSQGIIQKCKTNGDNLTTFTGLNDLENPAFYFPDWSSDGKYILFSKPFAPEGGIYYTTSDFSKSGRPFGLTLRAASQPEFSPDITHFIFLKGDQSFNRGAEIFITDTLGSNEVRLTDNNKDDRGPTWNPNGQQIAWSSGVRVHTMNGDGSNQKFLAYGQYPSWSVNNEIVFSHANADYSKEVLYSINSDGSDKKQITF